MQDGGYYAKDGVAFGLAESYFVFPDKTIDYIKNAKFEDRILEMAREKIEKIYRLPKEDVERFAEALTAAG